MASAPVTALEESVARRLRIQYAGALYHVINRGNYRRDIFGTVGAAQAFEAALGEVCARYRWRLHACPWKIQVAADLRRTGVTYHWIQQHLKMGGLSSIRGQVFRYSEHRTA